MICPDVLRPGDRVGLVAPARKVTQDEVKYAIRVLRDWGLVVVPGKNLFRSHHQFAGTDTERAADLQVMLDNPDIRCILCARGGYGTARLTGLLDFEKFSRSPKWIVGYSDITVLHLYVNNLLGVESIHAIMPLNMVPGPEREESILSLKKALFHGRLDYRVEGIKQRRTGTASGILTGGNLSILCSLRGTKLDPGCSNRILFLEDIDEYLYHVDRMLLNLKLGGKFEKIGALLCGEFTDMKDNAVPFGKDAENIIGEMAGPYSWPFATGFPAGHGKRNLALIMGRECRMDVTGNQVMLEFSPPA